MNETVSEKKPLIDTKERFAKELLTGGYIDSYIDFFYLGWKKTPDTKSKYQRDYIGDKEDKTSLVATRETYEIKSLKLLQEMLRNSEQILREAKDKHEIELAIDKYTEIRHKTYYLRDWYGAAYFNQKCIDLAKKYFSIRSLIKSLIDMGNCFDNSGESEDIKLSMDLKEKAKSFYHTHLNEKNYPLECTIYDSLVQLYKDMAYQQEKLKNYEQAIEYLQKQLDNLKNLSVIARHVKEYKDKEKDYEDKKNEIYLQIANLNFKLQNYEATLNCLEEIKDLIESNDSNVNTV